MVDLLLRGAYGFTQQNDYVKPDIDSDSIDSKLGGYQETGSPLNIAITPMLELGTDHITEGKTRTRAYIAAGASFLPNNSVTTQMALASGLSNTGTFDVNTNGPTVLGRLTLETQAYKSKDLEVRAQYGLQFDEGYLSNSMSANLTYRF